MKCRVCVKPDSEKPMCFRGTDHCSELHRKVLARELNVTRIKPRWAGKVMETYSKPNNTVVN